MFKRGGDCIKLNKKVAEKELQKLTDYCSSENDMLIKGSEAKHFYNIMWKLKLPIKICDVTSVSETRECEKLGVVIKQGDVLNFIFIGNVVLIVTENYVIKTSFFSQEDYFGKIRIKTGIGDFVAKCVSPDDIKGMLQKYIETH